MAEEAAVKINGNARMYELPAHLKRSLKKGEYAVYRLKGAYNEEGKFCGRTARVPNKDLIQDKDGDLHSIAFVTSYRADGTPVLGDIWFWLDSMCQIVLTHGARDAKAYNYLEICNFNESNPDRDTQAPVIFERVEGSTISKELRDKRKYKVQAVQVAQSLDNESVIRFINTNQGKFNQLRVSANPDGTLNYEEMREHIEALAESSPALFLKSTEALPSDKTEAGSIDIIQRAVDEEVIEFDKETKSWYNKATGKSILKVNRMTSGQPEKELAKFLQTLAGSKYMKLLTDPKN